MATNTTNYSFQKPTVSGDSGLWGGYLNSNWDKTDSLLSGGTAVTGIDINSGTIDGATIGGTTAGAGSFTTLSASSTFTLGGTAVTSTAAELNILDGCTATASELNILDGVTATTAEVNYLDGVTSNIQTQLDSKGTASSLSDFGVTATATELNYSSGVTSAIQTQINGKYGAPVHKSANYTASSGDYVVVTAGSITITLPASPSAGDYVTVKDGTGAAATTNFTVGRNGSNIASSATDLTFDKNFAEIVMTYVDATIGWTV